MGYSNSNSGSDSTVQTISFLRTTSNAGFEKCALALIGGSTPLLGGTWTLRTSRPTSRPPSCPKTWTDAPAVACGTRSLPRTTALEALLAASKDSLPSSPSVPTLPLALVSDYSSRFRWHRGLLERNSPCFSQILSIFFFCPPLQEILFSFLELFLPATLDLLSMLQGLCHPL